MYWKDLFREGHGKAEHWSAKGFQKCVLPCARTNSRLDCGPIAVINPYDDPESASQMLFVDDPHAGLLNTPVSDKSHAAPLK